MSFATCDICGEDVPVCEMTQHRIMHAYEDPVVQQRLRTLLDIRRVSLMPASPPVLVPKKPLYPEWDRL